MPAIVNVIGNLGRDPEMRYTANGRPVTEFSVAVNNGTKDPQTGEWTDSTDWYRCSVWGDRAERAAEQLKKGSKVTVWGRLKTRTYQRRDGGEGWSLDVSVDGYADQSPREDREGSFGNGAGPQRAAAPAGNRPAARSDEDLDDLPF